MASSCIPTGLRLPDLDMVKPAAAPGAAPLRPASASSTLSEASNSSSTSSLSLKRARTPRKRPNQTYNEAAALLASMHPSVFPAAGGHAPRLLGLASALADDAAACADLLPPFPVLGNAACLLRDAPPPPMPTPRSPVVVSKGCLSPAAVSSALFTEFRDSAPSPGTPDGAGADDPGELDFDDDDDGFDADSFLLGGVEEGAAEGIDGIMGKLSMEGSAVSGVNRVLSSSGVDPYLRSLMVLGLGFQRSRPNIKQALKRHDDDSEWWMCPAIPLKDIMVAPPPLMALPPPAVEKKKKKKTKKKTLKDIAVGPCKKCEDEIPDSVYGDDGILALKAPKTGLGLSLNTEEVLKAWYDRGSVFAGGNIPESSSTDGLAKPSDIELFLENGAAGGLRERGIQKMQHKQKQCTPLLSNKTRYQARKVNAECRPRVKGRFVSQASLLQKAEEKRS